MHAVNHKLYFKHFDVLVCAYEQSENLLAYPRGGRRDWQCSSPTRMTQNRIASKLI